MIMAGAPLVLRFTADLKETAVVADELMAWQRGMLLRVIQV